jgi:hypothetical protein
MPRKKQDISSRRLRVKVKLYDKDNNVLAIEGDELDEGVLDEETANWLLSENKAGWVEGVK